MQRSIIKSQYIVQIMEKMKNSGPYSSYMRRKPVDSCPGRPKEINKAGAVTARQR